LHAARYSLQSNRKIREGTSHPDRNAQFEHLNLQAQAFQQRGQPTISVDMKKTELIGEFRASGREGQPCGKPIEVLIHDLVDKNLGKLSYCGVCDLTENQGWVGVWTDHDTAWFAAEAIRRWWFKMGCHAHWQARELLITEDGGGNVNVRHTVDPCQSPSSPVHTAAPYDRPTPPQTVRRGGTPGLNLTPAVVRARMVSSPT
jgi:hypothetical protein